MYVQDKISVIPKRFFIEPGLKYNVVDTSMSENGNTYYDSIGGTITNEYSYLEPSLGISYNLLKNWIVYGSWGKIQAVPSITSYYELLNHTQTSQSTIPTTLNTRPEYITDYELGTRYQYNGLKLSVNGYKEDFQNTFAYYTDNSFTPPVTNTYNVGSSRYEGVEFAAEYKINRNSGVFGNWSDNTAVYTTSFTGSATGTSSGTGTSVQILAGEHLSDVPAQLANLGVYTSLWGTYVRIWGTYTGEQYVNDQYGQPTNLYHIGGYTVFNGYLSHNFDLSHIGFLKGAQFKAVKVSLSVNNILNRDYYPYAVINYNTVTPPNGSKFTYDYESVVPGLPRFFMVSATVKF
jgi:outer membrane receptor protein involved in Fe transport